MDVIEIKDDEPQFEFRESKARKIIFCIDISAEMSENLNPSANTGIKDSNLYSSSRIETTQRFLKRYASINKMIGNTRDMYGMITLSDQATWWYDFNPDINNFNMEIDLLESQVMRYYDTLDVESLFNMVNGLVTNDFFYHVIIIYSRTNVMPDLRGNRYKKIRDSPNMTMDVIFMHDNTPEVQDIYDFWTSLDSSVNPGWYYETGTNMGKDKLSKSLCELIGHPLQRGDQDVLKTV